MTSGRNRHATHPVNAMLNYAYAVLESQLRIATVSEGLDPTIGYLHSCRPEAWREGDHDDLVLSVALACWAGERYLNRGRVKMVPKPAGL